MSVHESARQTWNSSDGVAFTKIMYPIELREKSGQNPRFQTRPMLSVSSKSTRHCSGGFRRYDTQERILITVIPGKPHERLPQNLS